jgi:hypothetical protein
MTGGRVTRCTIGGTCWCSFAGLRCLGGTLKARRTNWRIVVSVGSRTVGSLSEVTSLSGVLSSLVALTVCRVEVVSREVAGSRVGGREVAGSRVEVGSRGVAGMRVEVGRLTLAVWRWWRWTTRTHGSNKLCI